MGEPLKTKVCSNISTTKHTKPAEERAQFPGTCTHTRVFLFDATVCIYSTRWLQLFCQLSYVKIKFLHTQHAIIL